MNPMNMEKKKYSVKMPFTGYIDIIVEADDEQSAKEQFYAEYDKCNSLHDALMIHDGEWDFHEQVVRGSVWYGTLSEMEITEQD